MAALRGLRRILCVLPLVALGACKGIEKGDKIDQILMVDKSTGTSVALAANATLQSYLCLRQQLGIVAVFSKNGSADYSTRPGAIWTSSNESVAHVSNGDDIVPSIDPTAPVRYYPKGVITPRSPGVTTITVNYAGIETSVNLQVQAPSSIILSTSPFDRSSDASSAPPLSMAVGSTQQFYAYALLPNSGGEADVSELLNVTGNATWSIKEDSNGTYASITNPATGTVSGGGLVTAISPGGPLTINAHLSACEGTPYGDVDLTTQVKVAGLSSLEIKHDPNFVALANPNPVPPLIVGTNEAFQAIGHLDNGDEQDLTYQSQFVVTGDANILSFVGNIGIADALGSTEIKASFTSAGSSILSDPLAIDTQEATLGNLNIAASDVNQSISAQSYYPYHALGTFYSKIDGSQLIQDMTHTVLWSSSNATLVPIGNAGNIFGIAIPNTTAQACVRITATSLTQNTDNSKFDGTTLGVNGVPTYGCED